MQIMYPGMVNSPVTELAAGITAAQTSITVLNGAVLPAAPNLAVIGQGELAETILYTAKSGNTLSGITRGLQGDARAWTAGISIARNFTEADYAALVANINELDTSKAGTDVATTVANGLMSSADKTKLDGVASGAQVNTVTSVAGKTGAVSLVKSDVGLGNVENYGIASQLQAESGTDNTVLMTPVRTAQAITKHLNSIGYAVGAYTGNGAAFRDISIPYSNPSAVIVKSRNAPSDIDNYATYFAVGSGIISPIYGDGRPQEGHGNAVSISGNMFRVYHNSAPGYSRANVSGREYFYIVFK